MYEPVVVVVGRNDFFGLQEAMNSHNTNVLEPCLLVVLAKTKKPISGPGWAYLPQFMPNFLSIRARRSAKRRHDSGSWDMQKQHQDRGLAALDI